MKHRILALSLAALALSGCAQLKEWYHDASPSAGASADEQRPYPTHFKNDHYYQP
jgi:hypothetical protein